MAKYSALQPKSWKNEHSHKIRRLKKLLTVKVITFVTCLEPLVQRSWFNLWKKSELVIEIGSVLAVSL